MDMNARKTNDRLLRKWTSERVSVEYCGIHIWDYVAYIQHKTTNAKTERLNGNTSSIRQNVIVSVCSRSASSVAYLTGMKLFPRCTCHCFYSAWKKCMQNQSTPMLQTAYPPFISNANWFSRKTHEGSLRVGFALFVPV